jgi:hypothetical protein
MREDYENETDELNEIDEEEKPLKMTLYQAYRRGVFSEDPEKNLEIYNKKRRGYEGREKTVLVTL